MDHLDLAGRRILVVEDDFFLAADICAQIEAYGGVVIGPASSLVKGQLLFQAEPYPDGCILNIRLGNEMVYPLADSLMEANVPLIFASGESKDSIPEEYASIPLMSKPINMIQVAEHLFYARN